MFCEGLISMKELDRRAAAHGGSRHRRNQWSARLKGRCTEEGSRAPDPYPDGGKGNLPKMAQDMCWRSTQPANPRKVLFVPEG